MQARHNFDSGKTRHHLFADNPAFARKIVITNRILWIAGTDGSPSENHAWLVFDWMHKGPATLAYDARIIGHYEQGEKTT
jgi:hypothetical protein